MLIQAYQNSWIEDFNNINKVIQAALLDLDISIEHIGGTAIPNLAAKPIYTGVLLAANTDYKYNQLTTTFTSNNSTMITYTLSATVGQFYNGKSYTFSGTGNLRIIPKVLISLSTNFDRILLPKPYSSANIVLISPKFNITFAKSLFWSTLIQYSNQRNNLGINSRLQWRFAPLSDLYLVYNDNYYTDYFSPSYRSINLKFTYWLNL